MTAKSQKRPCSYETDIHKKCKLNLAEKESELKKKYEEIVQNNRVIEEFQRKIKDLQRNHKEEIEKLKRSTFERDHKREIEKLKEKILLLEKENDKLRSKIQILERDNAKLRNKVEKLEDTVEKLEDTVEKLEDTVEKLEENVDSHMLYIAQIAAQFSENTYRIVMGADHFEDYYPAYYLSEIESNICEIQDIERRKKAEQSWKKLKKKVKWSPQKEQVMKQLRKQRNRVAHPVDLNKAKAQEAIDELHKQNRLKGLISKDKVQDILDMWEKSCNLQASRI